MGQNNNLNKSDFLSEKQAPRNSQYQNYGQVDYNKKQMLAMDSKDQLYHPLTSRESSGNLFGFSATDKLPLEIKNTDSMKLLPKTEPVTSKVDVK